MADKAEVIKGLADLFETGDELAEGEGFDRRKRYETLALQAWEILVEGYDPSIFIPEEHLRRR
jgi:hypothetical protein